MRGSEWCQRPFRIGAGARQTRGIGWRGAPDRTLCGASIFCRGARVMVDRLWVFLSDNRVGLLEDRAGDMQFTYEPGVQTPLSVNLPTRAQPYDNPACRPFFGNLLPEGSWR